MKLSVVIICRNEYPVIGDTIRPVQTITDDIVVVDSGSTDGTLELLRQLPVKLIEKEWTGFGPAKNCGIDAAKHDWILSLDADEQVDEQLARTIKAADYSNAATAYILPFRSYLGNTPLRFGEWGRDEHIRLFNRQGVRWNDAAVHEELQLPPGTIIKKLSGGYIHHKTSAGAAELRSKMTHYARLNALKYYKQGKKGAALKMWLSPAVNFITHYIFRLGFFDGRAGWTVARESARYTWLKYYYLRKLNCGEGDELLRQNSA